MWQWVIGGVRNEIKKGPRRSVSGTFDRTAENYDRRERLCVPCVSPLHTQTHTHNSFARVSHESWEAYSNCVGGARDAQGALSLLHESFKRVSTYAITTPRSYNLEHRKRRWDVVPSLTAKQQITIHCLSPRRTLIGNELKFFSLSLSLASARSLSYLYWPKLYTIFLHETCEIWGNVSR